MTSSMPVDAYQPVDAQPPLDAPDWGPGGPVAPGAPGSVKPPKRVDWQRVVPLAVVVGITIVFGLAFLLVIGHNIGLVPLLVGLGAAIIPVPFLIAAFLWLDRYEPEPPVYLAFCFVWGAFVATTAAFFANTGMAKLFHHYGLPDALVAVGVAPVIEESLKALGPLLLLFYTLWKKRRVWSGVLDSIVFFGLSATGFAMSENVLYLGGYGYAHGADKGGVAGGLSGVVGVFIGRVPLSGFAHPLFTSMTALGVGLAIRSTDKRVKILAPITGWFAAMLLHGSWNLMATLAESTGHSQVLLYGYFSVMMPIFFGMAGFAMWLRSREGRLTQTNLTPYVRRGWLSPPEVASLASIGRRRSAIAWARRVAGKAGADGMRGFQLAATQLALVRDRVNRRAEAAPYPADGAYDASDSAEEQQLLWLVSAYRGAYTGHDPLAPQALWDGSRYHVRFPDGVTRAIPEPPVPVVPVPVVRAPIYPPYPMYPGMAPQFPGYPANVPGAAS